jgi:hypothetical protein
MLQIGSSILRDLQRSDDNSRRRHPHDDTEPDIKFDRVTSFIEPTHCQTHTAPFANRRLLALETTMSRPNL